MLLTNTALITDGVHSQKPPQIWLKPLLIFRQPHPLLISLPVAPTPRASSFQGGGFAPVPVPKGALCWFDRKLLGVVPLRVFTKKKSLKFGFPSEMQLFKQILFKKLHPQQGFQSRHLNKELGMRSSRSAHSESHRDRGSASP